MLSRVTIYKGIVMDTAFVLRRLPRIEWNNLSSARRNHAAGKTSEVGKHQTIILTAILFVLSRSTSVSTQKYQAWKFPRRTRHGSEKGAAPSSATAFPCSASQPSVPWVLQSTRVAEWGGIRGPSIVWSVLKAIGERNTPSFSEGALELRSEFQ